jgi:signal transduction histidine kinase
LTLRSLGDQVELRVEDHGKGRALDEPPLGTHASGVGIPSMRERLHLIGGELDVDSGPGWTTITARAPMNGSTP